jgi:hypothetical protein
MIQHDISPSTYLLFHLLFQLGSSLGAIVGFDHPLDGPLSMLHDSLHVVSLPNCLFALEVPSVSQSTCDMSDKCAWLTEAEAEPDADHHLSFLLPRAPLIA